VPLLFDLAMISLLWYPIPLEGEARPEYSTSVLSVKMRPNPEENPPNAGLTNVTCAILVPSRTLD